MAQHFIIISSDYSSGRRIGLHYSLNDSQDMSDVITDVTAIRKYCSDDVQFATHKLITDSNSWDSVIQSDSFFENIEIVSTVFDFIKIINKDRILTADDVAEYILSVIPCTHLKLEKLVYLCYADYLCNIGQKLFTDKIYAYRYGPVIQSIYNKYKIYKSQTITTEGFTDKIDDIIDLPFDESLKTPMLARVLFSNNGIKAVESIIKTLSKNGDSSSTTLVGLTHSKDSPWANVYTDNKKFVEITDEIILKKHCNEN